MVLSGLQHELATEYLLECFDMNHQGRVVWRRRPSEHFEGKQRRPRNRKVGKIAARKDGRITLDGSSYAETDIAWRIQIGYVPQGCRIRRIDRTTTSCYANNLKMIGKIEHSVRSPSMWRIADPTLSKPKLSFL